MILRTESGIIAQKKLRHAADHGIPVIDASIIFKVHGQTIIDSLCLICFFYYLFIPNAVGLLRTKAPFGPQRSSVRFFAQADTIYNCLHQHLCRFIGDRTALF